MDEKTQLKLHDLAAVRRCCDDARAYLDRLMTSTPPLPAGDLQILRTHIERLGHASLAADLMAQRIRDTVQAA